MNSKKKISILYSGGLDSFIMYHYAKVTEPNAEIKCTYWDHGQPVANREIAGLPSFVEIKKVDWLNDNITTVVQPGRREGAIMIPGRNLVFGVLIGCQDLPDEIWMGTLHGETHAKGTDKNYTFADMLESTLNYVVGPFKNHNPIKIRFPLAEAGLNKLESVKWGLNNGLSFDDLRSTRSCHDGNTNRCGNCIQCLKRWAAFGTCGFTEQYDVNPPQSEFGSKMIHDLLKCELSLDDYYGDDSRAELIPFILKYIETYPEHFNQKIIDMYNNILKVKP